jgi:hypothetical protein
MKKQILKIAGVKSEKEFYKKYPTEEAFMKSHSKAFKKAQIGTFIGGEQDSGFQPISFKDVYDEADYTVTGSTEDMRREEAYRQAELAAAQQQGGSGSGGGLGNIAGALGNIGKMFGEEGGGEGMADAASAFAGAKKGKNIKKAQGGTQTQPEPQQSDYPDYQSWKADHDLWSSGQTYIGMGASSSGGISTSPASISNPTLEIEEKKGDWMKQVGKYAGPAGKIVQGIQQLKEEKRALERAEQARDVSGLVKQAASTRPEETQRRYVRPEDITNTGEEFFPIYGVGTNVLAKNGTSVGGGEIMNTFAPDTLYDDLGYEPLDDSQRYKQFYHGGKMHKAQNGDWMEGTGFYDFASSGGTDAAGQLLTGITGENAGGNLGGTIGGTAGMLIGGPAGKLIGQTAGQLIGTAINRKPQKIDKAKEATQRNIQGAALQQGMQGGQAQYSSFMENGGTTSPYEWVSHTWQPQVIASFGEHKVKDLLRRPKDADMLRAGGHLKEYTPPSAAAMSTERPDFQMGGELKTHWGGYAETMSQNPYLPDGGETIMFRGQSHDESDGRGNTGIGITYGDNPVEVERGEPAMKMKDGGGAPGDSSLVVFGNLKIPKAYVPFLSKEAEGRKFKTYVADLSKKESKINKNVDKAINQLEELSVQSPFDKLRLNSLDLTINGGNAKLKEIADNKTSAASLQNAINDTAEEYGFVADDLAKGKVKIDKKAFNEAAKFGKMIKAQGGVTAAPVTTKERVAEIMALYEKAKQVNAQNPGKKNPFILELQKKYHEYFPEIAEQIITKSSGVTAKAKSKGINTIADLKKQPRETILETNLDEYFGPRTEQYIAALPKTFDIPTGGLNIPKKDEPVIEKTTTAETTIPITPYKRNTLVDIFGQILPYVRPSDMETLDPNQLMGEMYALSTNQLEPVQAQTLQPQLDIPYDISLQDQLNENEATFRSQQRLMGYNPAAQAQLNAQKYQANQRVLGEQFRMNQSLKGQVYRDNRNLLNQFNMQNLAILDKQYERQAIAKSKTKATTLEALKSIGDKYMRNQLENRTLATYENMYNYRYDPRFRAINMNAPFQAQMPTVYSGPGQQGIPVLDAQGNVVAIQQAPAQQAPGAPAMGASSKGTVPAAAPSASTVQPFVPLSDQEVDDQSFTTEDVEERYKRGGRKGVDISKKKNLNSSIINAFRNI